MLDQRLEIGGIVGGIGPAPNRIRRREAAMCEGNARMARSEMRDLLPPAQVVAAKPMGEQKGWAAARDLIIEIAERAFQPAAAPRRRAVGSHQKRFLSEEDQTRAPHAQRPASRYKQSKLAFERRDPVRRKPRQGK